MPVINVNHFSMYLRRNMDCTVVLPEKLDKDEQLKCIWLYHGSSGDHRAWLYHAPLVEHVQERHCAMVLPNVNESCFVDMNIGDRYGTYVGKELPSIIHNMFRCISSKREDNYVAGFSNGGYGCFHTIFSYPQKYSIVGAFSAGDKADADFPNDGRAKSINRIRLFGDGDIHNTDYSIIHLADKLLQDYKDKNKLSGKPIKLPRIYHACGGKDPWLDANHIVREYFVAHGDEYDYTYDEISNLGHEWKFWQIELEKFMDYAGLKKNNA